MFMLSFRNFHKWTLKSLQSISVELLKQFFTKFFREATFHSVRDLLWNYCPRLSHHIFSCFHKQNPFNFHRALIWNHYFTVSQCLTSSPVMYSFFQIWSVIKTNRITLLWVNFTFFDAFSPQHGIIRLISHFLRRCHCSDPSSLTYRTISCQTNW